MKCSNSSGAHSFAAMLAWPHSRCCTFVLPSLPPHGSCQGGRRVHALQARAGMLTALPACSPPVPAARYIRGIAARGTLLPGPPCPPFWWAPWPGGAALGCEPVPCTACVRRLCPWLARLRHPQHIPIAHPHSTLPCPERSPMPRGPLCCKCSLSSGRRTRLGQAHFEAPVCSTAPCKVPG